jgi:RsiW-degrading membrane proteinase PrsW (M82 family)
MLATAAFVIAAYYGRDLIRHQPARRIAMTLFVGAFAVAAIAGVLGALITKKAPVT